MPLVAAYWHVGKIDGNVNLTLPSILLAEWGKYLKIARLWAEIFRSRPQTRLRHLPHPPHPFPHLSVLPLPVRP